MSTLYIDRQGSQLTVQTGVLHITTPDGEADRRLPLKYLDRVVLRTETQLSSKVLCALADSGVNLIALGGRGGQKIAQITGTPHNDARRVTRSTPSSRSATPCSMPKPPPPAGPLGSTQPWAHCTP